MPRTKSSFRKKPGYKARSTGKKRGRVKFSRATVNRAYLRGKQAGARKKDFKARRAAKAKENAKRRRREKKVNKAISRVLTDMNDAKATMYRQYVDPNASIRDTLGDNRGLDGIVGNISDGDFVTVKDPALQYLLRRNETNFFQIEAYHGMVAPSWQDGFNPTTILHDNQHITDTGIGPDLDNNTRPSPPANDRIDIRAFKEVELPFLPCIPSKIWNANSVKYTHELDQFCRENNKIKITNNYMRFRFFATPNGHIEQTGTPLRLRMTGNYSNIEPVFRGMRTHNELGVPYGTDVNEVVEYKITAKRFAKVRIILYERDQEEQHPVRLEDFMKFGKHNLDKNGIEAESRLMPGGNLFTTEEYRLGKRFSSPRKKKRDCLYGADTATEERLMGGKLIMDKVINLPMGKETVFTCNPLAGKVLEYDDAPPQHQFNDDGDDNMGHTEDGASTITERNNNDVTGLPLHVNRAFPLYLSNGNDLDTSRQKAEYKPKKKQYGMFMLLYCQRAGIEYDIFQKFEYDK
jgi:hypothetical protein